MFGYLDSFGLLCGYCIRVLCGLLVLVLLFRAVFAFMCLFGLFICIV